MKIYYFHRGRNQWVLFSSKEFDSIEEAIEHITTTYKGEAEYWGEQYEIFDALIIKDKYGRKVWSNYDSRKDSNTLGW